MLSTFCLGSADANLHVTISQLGRDLHALFARSSCKSKRFNMLTSTALSSRPALAHLRAGASHSSTPTLAPLQAPRRHAPGRQSLRTACIATPAAPSKGGATVKQVEPGG